MKRAMITVIVLASIAAASGDQAVNPPAELRLLEDTIGTWDEVVTNKPTEWRPKAERQVSLTNKTWSLGGKYIRMEGTWNEPKLQFLSLVGFDPDAKVYRTWYFDSGVSIPQGPVKGTWDAKTRTMTWTGTDEAGNKSVGKTKIIHKDRHEWTVVTTSPEGKVLLDLSAVNTRHKG